MLNLTDHWQVVVFFIPFSHYRYSCTQRALTFFLQVNSEFYTGWLDNWGSHHAVVSADWVAKSLNELLRRGANVNMYVPWF